MNIRTIRTISSPILSEEDMLNVLGGKLSTGFEKMYLGGDNQNCGVCEQNHCQNTGCNNTGECDGTDD